MRGTRAMGLVFMLVGVAACGAPSISEYEPHRGIIRGTVIVREPAAGTSSCLSSPPRGHAVLFLFDADAPPPPQGSGRPENFVVISKEALFPDGAGQVQAGTLFTAPFVMPAVEPGRYQIRGFVDADLDFNPAVDWLSQPSAGDLAGGHVDPATGQFLDIEVEADRASDQVTVTLGLRLPTERPAFAFTGTTSFTVPMKGPVATSIVAHRVDRPHFGMDTNCTRFAVSFADDDGDGSPDDANGDRLPDLYPRVVFRRSEPLADGRSAIVPVSVNPFPFLDALNTDGEALVEALELIVPTFAILRSASGKQAVGDIPPGDYETILMTRAGQTWQLPNDLDSALPGSGPDPTQSEAVHMVAGPPRPPGILAGRVALPPGVSSDVFVFAFPATDPPPPRGRGRPRAVALVPAVRFDPSTEGSAARFELGGLEDGTYVISGLADLDGDFSPYVSLVAEPSAGDLVGTGAQLHSIVGGGRVEAELSISRAVPGDRPVFSPEAALELERAALPARFSLEVSGLDVLGIDASAASFPVVLAGGDADFDNLPDLYPRIVLTKIADGADPRTGADDPDQVILPALVDPIPFLFGLSGDAPIRLARGLPVILPGQAYARTAGGSVEPIGPAPAGRYRIHVMTAHGQTWSVPNAVDLGLSRGGTEREDPTQARFLSMDGPEPDRGYIRGTVAKPGGVSGDFSAVIVAYGLFDPPPPRGRGRPVAAAVVHAEDFDGDTAAYELAGLPTAQYLVMAFLDVNDDLTPWFDTLNQPNRGDMGGGHLDAALRPLPVAVDASGASSDGVDVSFDPRLAFPYDRPAFQFDGAPAMTLSAETSTVTVSSLAAVTELLSVQGSFPVQWIDLDRDGTADDIDGDGRPNAFPMVVAELLEPSDSDGFRSVQPAVRIFGAVSLAPLAASFPIADPSAVSTVVEASSLRLVFPRVAFRDGEAAPIEAPVGRYRVTLVNARGQTWSVPNELARATGASFAEGQGMSLEVRP